VIGGLVSRMLPKVYGDRVRAEVSGPDGGPVETSSVAPTEWAKALLLKHFKANGGACYVA
jgi:hypothetical protein